MNHMCARTNRNAIDVDEVRHRTTEKKFQALELSATALSNHWNFFCHDAHLSRGLAPREAVFEDGRRFLQSSQDFEAQKRVANTLARDFRRAIRDVRPKPALTLIPITPARLREKQAEHDYFFETIMKEGVCVATKD